MQPPTVREVIWRLNNEGWKEVRQTGSHKRYKRGNRSVTIAGKPSEHLKWRTWMSVKKLAGW